MYARNSFFFFQVLYCCLDVVVFHLFAGLFWFSIALSRCCVWRTYPVKKTEDGVSSAGQIWHERFSKGYCACTVSLGCCLAVSPSLWVRAMKRKRGWWVSEWREKQGTSDWVTDRTQYAVSNGHSSGTDSKMMFYFVNTRDLIRS